MKVALLLASIAIVAAGEDAPAPEKKVQHRLPLLASIFPQGSTAGTTVRALVLGEHLDRAFALLPLDAALTGRLVSVEPTRLEVELTVARDAAPGPHYFRVVSPRGASNIVLFRVGDQPHHSEHEPNTSLEQAERVDVPVTINGRLDIDGDSDFFRFRARAGETWLFDLRAARNGNGLDPALILVDSSGHKLQHEEDSLIWDPFFAHRFEADGEYIAIVQPTSARNDPNNAYQLDIRRAAYLETVSPIALQPGATTEVTLHGRALLDSKARLRFPRGGFSGELLQARGDSAAARIRIPADAKPGAYELMVESGGLSNPATFLVDATPPWPGSGAAKAPAAVTGVAKYRQPERFRFRAESGQTLVFEVRAQRFGSPVDSILRVVDASGKTIATNDDAAFPGASFNKDSRISHQFKEGAEFWVEMRNVSAVTGEDFPYQLVMFEPKPAAELMMATDQPYVYPGKPAKVRLSVERHDGHASGIPLAMDGLPEGVTAKPAVAAGESKEGVIEIEAGAAKPGAHGVIAISGGGQQAWRSVRISSGGGEGATFVRVDRAVLVVAEKPLFSLECAQTGVNLVRGAGAELKVTIRRDEGFREKLSFQADNLPHGVTMETVDSGEEVATVRFRAEPNAPTGRAARVSVKGSGGGQTNAAPRISILVD